MNTTQQTAETAAAAIESTGKALASLRLSAAREFPSGMPDSLHDLSIVLEQVEQRLQAEARLVLHTTGIA